MLIGGRCHASACSTQKRLHERPCPVFRQHGGPCWISHYLSQLAPTHRWISPLLRFRHQDLSRDLAPASQPAANLPPSPRPPSLRHPAPRCCLRGTPSPWPRAPRCCLRCCSRRHGRPAPTLQPSSPLTTRRSRLFGHTASHLKSPPKCAAPRTHFLWPAPLRRRCRRRTGSGEQAAVACPFAPHEPSALQIYALVHVAQYAAITPGADEELATAEAGEWWRRHRQIPLAPTPPTSSLFPPAAAAAYAGHTAMGLLFPWRWDKSDAALQPLIADLPEDVRKQGEAAGRAAALAVVGERCGPAAAGLGAGWHGGPSQRRPAWRRRPRQRLCQRQRPVPPNRALAQSRAPPPLARCCPLLAASPTASPATLPSPRPRPTRPRGSTSSRPARPAPSTLRSWAPAPSSWTASTRCGGDGLQLVRPAVGAASEREPLGSHQGQRPASCSLHAVGRRGHRGGLQAPAELPPPHLTLLRCARCALRPCLPACSSSPSRPWPWTAPSMLLS